VEETTTLPYARLGGPPVGGIARHGRVSASEQALVCAGEYIADASAMAKPPFFPWDALVEENLH